MTWQHNMTMRMPFLCGLLDGFNPLQPLSVTSASSLSCCMMCPLPLLYCWLLWSKSRIEIFFIYPPQQQQRWAWYLFGLRPAVDCIGMMLVAAVVDSLFTTAVCIVCCGTSASATFDATWPHSSPSTHLISRRNKHPETDGQVLDRPTLLQKSWKRC